MRSFCRRRVITTSTSARPLFHVVVHAARPRFSTRRDQGLGAMTRTIAGAEYVEGVDLGARDPGVQDVADDGHRQPG
jgi:hypothetical protein